MEMANENSSRLHYCAKSLVLASTVTSEAKALHVMGRAEEAAKAEERLKPVQASTSNPK